MTRIVRLEEIDGDLVLRVPAEMAARLKFAVGEEVAMSDVESSLKIEQIDPEKLRQMKIVEKILLEDDAVLRALAK